MASVLDSPLIVQDETQFVHGSSLWQDAWYRLRKNKLALFGLGCFLTITLLCLIGPLVTGYSYEQTDLTLKASPPSDKIIQRTETLKNGEKKISFYSLTNIEDEFVEKPRDERKRIAATLAGGEDYSEGVFAYQSSSQKHLFGTDALGRDLLTRVLVGGRLSLSVGFVATLISVAIGVVWGTTAGFVGGVVDNLMMRFVDVLYALPFTVIEALLINPD